MAQITVAVDDELLRRAAQVLGTDSHAATVNGALRSVVDAFRRDRLVNLLASSEHFDFESIETAWGGD